MNQAPSSPSSCTRRYDFRNGLPADLSIENGKVTIEDGFMRFTMYQGRSVKVSHGDLFQYGHFSWMARAANAPGAVSAVILLSSGGDEIDIEYVGKNPDQLESNIFFKGIKEFGTYGAVHKVPSISEWHRIGINWTPESISWSLNDQVVRVLRKDQSYSSKHALWMFPEDPSKFEFGLWDGKDVSGWAGGPIDWSLYPFGIIMDIGEICYKAYVPQKTLNSNIHWEDPLSNVVLLGK